MTDYYEEKMLFRLEMRISKLLKYAFEKERSLIEIINEVSYETEKQ